MSTIRFFTDEDIFGAVAVQLRAKGFDALSTPEAGRCGADDESQLQFASQERRALVSFNVTDFARLHQEGMNQGQHHAGVVVSSRRSIGDMLRRPVLGRGDDLDRPVFHPDRQTEPAVAAVD